MSIIDHEELLASDVYFTGTTWECAQQIVEDGYVSIRPPGRVWPDYSEEFIYVVSPELIRKEECYDDIFEASMRRAAEQASYAVWKLDHTRRIVFEIKGLERALLGEDPHAHFALRYPMDIELSRIRGVYVEQRNICRRLKGMVALDQLFRREPMREIWEYYERADLYHEYKGLEHLNIRIGQDLYALSEDLRVQESQAGFYYVPMDAFIKKVTRRMAK